MWEGQIQERKFKNFKIHNARTETEGRRILVDRGVEHYWTMLETFRDKALDL